MKHKCIFSSALLLYLALTIPSWCAFCVLLYLIPLFYWVIRSQGTLSFFDGFIWAAVLYTVHWYDIAILAHTHGHGAGRYVVMPFLVICSAVYAGLWFWSASWFSMRSQQFGIVWV